MFFLYYIFGSNINRFIINSHHFLLQSKKRSQKTKEYANYI